MEPGSPIASSAASTEANPVLTDPTEALAPVLFNQLRLPVDSTSSALPMSLPSIAPGIQSGSELHIDSTPVASSTNPTPGSPLTPTAVEVPKLPITDAGYQTRLDQFAKIYAWAQQFAPPGSKSSSRLSERQRDWDTIQKLCSKIATYQHPLAPLDAIDRFKTQMHDYLMHEAPATTVSHVALPAHSAPPPEASAHAPALSSIHGPITSNTPRPPNILEARRLGRRTDTSTEGFEEQRTPDDVSMSNKFIPARLAGSTAWYMDQVFEFLVISDGPTALIHINQLAHRHFEAHKQFCPSYGTAFAEDYIPTDCIRVDRHPTLHKVTRLPHPPNPSVTDGFCKNIQTKQYHRIAPPPTVLRYRLVCHDWARRIAAAFFRTNTFRFRDLPSATADMAQARKSARDLHLAAIGRAARQFGQAKGAFNSGWLDSILCIRHAEVWFHSSQVANYHTLAMQLRHLVKLDLVVYANGKVVRWTRRLPSGSLVECGSEAGKQFKDAMGVPEFCRAFERISTLKSVRVFGLDLLIKESDDPEERRAFFEVFEDSRSSQHYIQDQILRSRFSGSSYMVQVSSIKEAVCNKWADAVLLEWADDMRLTGRQWHLLAYLALLCDADVYHTIIAVNHFHALRLLAVTKSASPTLAVEPDSIESLVSEYDFLCAMTYLGNPAVLKPGFRTFGTTLLKGAKLHRNSLGRIVPGRREEELCASIKRVLDTVCSSPPYGAATWNTSSEFKLYTASLAVDAKEKEEETIRRIHAVRELVGRQTRDAAIAFAKDRTARVGMYKKALERIEAAVMAEIDVEEEGSFVIGEVSDAKDDVSAVVQGEEGEVTEMYLDVPMDSLPSPSTSGNPKVTIATDGLPWSMGDPSSNPPPEACILPSCTPTPIPLDYTNMPGEWPTGRTLKAHDEEDVRPYGSHPSHTGDSVSIPSREACTMPLRTPSPRLSSYINMPGAWPLSRKRKAIDEEDIHPYIKKPFIDDRSSTAVGAGKVNGMLRVFMPVARLERALRFTKDVVQYFHPRRNLELPSSQI